MKPAFSDLRSLSSFLCRGNGAAIGTANDASCAYVYWQQSAGDFGGHARFYLGVHADGTPFAGRHEGPLRNLDILIRRHTEFDLSMVVAEFQAAQVMRRLRGTPESKKPAPREAAAVVDDFCARIDIEALTCLACLPTWLPEHYAWLTDPDCRASRMMICRAYPWAIPILKHADDFGLLDETAGEPGTVLLDASVRMLENLGRKPSLGTLRAVIRATRNSTLGRVCLPGPSRGLTNLNDVPVHWIPKVSDPGNSQLAEMAVRNLDALLIVLPPLRDFATATDSAPDDRFGPEGETWSAAVRRLLVRSGVDDDESAAVAPIDSIVDCTSPILVDQANDFISACVSHLLKPAVALVRPNLAPAEPIDTADNERLGLLAWEFFDVRNGRHALMKAAFRLLARDKTLPGFVEEVRNWHSRMTDLNNVIAQLCPDVRWPRAFADFQGPQGTVVRCVSSAAELLEEAVAMDNCAASYLDDCASGECIVASVRDRRGERIGTVEFLPIVPEHTGRRNGQRRRAVALQIEQAVGHGNADAPAAVLRAAEAVSLAVGNGTLIPDLPPTNDRRDKPGAIQVALAAAGGSPERFAIMMDAWKPFLTRELRLGSAADVIAASGLDLSVFSDAH